MLLARRCSLLALLLGSACAAPDAPATKGEPELSSTNFGADRSSGGQTGSGGNPYAGSCLSLGDEVCGTVLRDAVSGRLPRFGRAEWVRSRCVAASSLEVSLPSEAGVCQCQFFTSNDYGSIATASVDVGLPSVRAALSTSTDPCAARQEFLTDSVCLMDGAEFSGCSPTEPTTSCADTCRQIHARGAAEAETRWNGIEWFDAGCDEFCGNHYCAGTFRLGDRCFAERLPSRPELDEVSCELSLEQMQTPYLSPWIVERCNDEQLSVSPSAYCLRGPEPTVVVANPERPILGMALDATYLYWGTESAIFRQPKAGGAAQKLVDDIFELSSLAVDSSRLYWQSSQLLFSLSLDDKSSPVRLADDANMPGVWTVRDAQVYYTSRSDCASTCSRYLDSYFESDLPEAQLRTVAGAGGSALTLATPRALMTRLAVDATGVYWDQLAAWPTGGLAQPFFPPEIRKYKFTDQSVTTFFVDRADFLFAAGDRVLWGGEGHAWSSTPDGSDLVELTGTTANLTTDGTTVYWTSASGGGNLVTVPIAGGAPRLSNCVVFDAGSWPRDPLLADESALYFRSSAGDRIVRLPKSFPRD